MRRPARSSVFLVRARDRCRGRSVRCRVLGWAELMSVEMLWFQVRLEQGDVTPDTVYHINFYYEVGGSVDVVDAAPVLREHWIPVLAAVISPGLKFHQLYTSGMVQLEDDPDTDVSFDVFGAPGSATGFPLPSFAALVVNRKAEDDGNHHKGRIFIPAPGSQVLTDVESGSVDIEHPDVEAVVQALTTELDVGGVLLRPARRVALTNTVKVITYAWPSLFLGVNTSRRYGRFF